MHIMSTYIAPRNGLEIKIARSFEEVLKVEQVSLRDNFFALGGNSLLAMALFSRLSTMTTRQSFFATMARDPTVEAIAREVAANIKPVDEGVIVCLQKGDEGKTPLLFCHAIGGTIMFYHELTYRLGRGRPFYAIQAKGLQDGEKPLASIVEMAELYVASLGADLLSRRPVLGGYSFGCLIAVQMAKVLEARGYYCSDLFFVAPPRADHTEYQRKNGDGAEFETKANDLLAAFLEREGVSVSPEVGEMLTRLYKANIAAPYGFCAPTIKSNITHFLPEEDPVEKVERLCADWQKRTSGRCRYVRVPGEHTTLIREPKVHILAGAITRCVSEIEQRSHVVQNIIEGV